MAKTGQVSLGNYLQPKPETQALVQKDQVSHAKQMKPPERRS